MSSVARNDRVGPASAWLLLGVAGGLGLDLCAKEVLASYSLAEFVFVRSAVALLLFLLLAKSIFGGIGELRSKRWRWHALRTVLAVGAMYGFFYGLSHMPLVNALTLGFTAPLMVTALSVPLLGEHVGWRRWLAVFAGFAGVLLMLRPGSGSFDLAAAAILLAAFCYACQIISARYLGNTESTLALAFYIVVGPLLVAVLLLGKQEWVVPDLKGWVLMCAAGVCSAIAWVGFINGYRMASPAILAPLEYLALVGGAVAGYLIWGEVPDRWVVAGAAIIVGSGIFVVYREIQST